MLEALKGEEVVDKAGGRFKLCALIQRRLVELMDGARPLIEREGRNDLEVVMEEIMQGKITIELDDNPELQDVMGPKAIDAPAS